MNLQAHPLTPERWPDLEAIFNGKGCSQARGCWCMYYRKTGAGSGDIAGDQARLNRDALRALVDRGVRPGLVGYRDGEPVGWVSLGPREEFLKLQRSPVMKPLDEEPAWAIICFVVPSPYRGQGVARALLAAATDYARSEGATLLEAFPVDKPARSDDSFMWFGSRSMFAAAGFEEVARRRPNRPFMRLRLG